MATFFCSQTLLYTYGMAGPMGGPFITYYMYSGKSNNDHQPPCLNSAFSSNALLNQQNCPMDPCIRMARIKRDSPPNPLSQYEQHDFAPGVIALAAPLEADHDKLEPSPAPTPASPQKILFSWTYRFFVKFSRIIGEKDVYAQCRMVIVTEPKVPTLVTHTGFEINALPKGNKPRDVPVAPDIDPVTGDPMVEKMDPGNPNSGLYRVTINGDQYHIICTPDN